MPGLPERPPAPARAPAPALVPGGPAPPPRQAPPRPPKQTSESMYLRPGLFEDRPAWPVALGTAAAAFVLYVVTCSRFVLSGDAAEFQALAAGHGTAHAGYPLYLLLLEGFHRVPLLTAPWRANLTSALAAAVAVGLTAAAAMRYTRSLIAAVAAAFALALSYSLWHDATRAEIYPFALALAAGALLSYSHYVEARGVDALAMCGILLGLSLTTHLSSWALAGVIAVAFLVDLLRGRSPWGHALIAFGAVLVGLVPLILIPLRDTPANSMNYLAYQHSAGDIPWSAAVGARLRRAGLLLAGGHYFEGGRFRLFGDALDRVRLLGWNLALNDFPGIGLLLAVAGVVGVFLRRHALDFLLLGWLACLTFLFACAANPVSATSFFLPGTMILALLLAHGISLLRGRLWPAALVLALVVIAAPWVRLRLPAPPAPLAGATPAAMWETWPRRWSPFASDRSWEEYGRGVLGALPRRAHVFGCWEEATTLLATQRSLGLRTDVAIHIACEDRGSVRSVIAAARRGGARVFTTVPPRRLPTPSEWAAVRTWRRGGLWRYQGGR